MKVFVTSTCPRCGFQSSFVGFGPEDARNYLASIHTCADGVRTTGVLGERIVPGPGERQKLPEEQGR